MRCIAVPHGDRGVRSFDAPRLVRGISARELRRRHPLLGTYLIEHGFGPFDYALGERGSLWCTHAWLRRGQLDVDITADQFADAPGPIIVCVKSSWHRTFRQRIEHVGDFRIYDEQTVSSLSTVYRLMVDRLKLNDGWT